MRLDKFLQVSRLVKRRTLAKEICGKGKVSINGRVAKPASELKAGDLLKIDFGFRVLEVEILTVPAEKQSRGEELYRILREEKKLRLEDSPGASF